MIIKRFILITRFSHGTPDCSLRFQSKMLCSVLASIISTTELICSVRGAGLATQLPRLPTLAQEHGSVHSQPIQKYRAYIQMILREIFHPSVSEGNSP